MFQGEGSRVSIVCTQPRRVAAISVAERVASERGETVGDTVGYQARPFHLLRSCSVLGLDVVLDPYLGLMDPDPEPDSTSFLYWL